MDIQGLYAAVFVKDISAASSFYAKVLGREADDKPMPTLVQWRPLKGAGIQLFQDAAKAGKGIMTLVVPDLAAVESQLNAQGLHIDPIQSGNFGKISHLVDPDGNVVTLAEPPKRD